MVANGLKRPRERKREEKKKHYCYEKEYCILSVELRCKPIGMCVHASRPSNREKKNQKVFLLFGRCWNGCSSCAVVVKKDLSPPITFQWRSSVRLFPFPSSALPSHNEQIYSFPNVHTGAEQYVAVVYSTLSWRPAYSTWAATEREILVKVNSNAGCFLVHPFSLRLEKLAQAFFADCLLHSINPAIK